MKNIIAIFMLLLPCPVWAQDLCVGQDGNLVRCEEVYPYGCKCGEPKITDYYAVWSLKDLNQEIKPEIVIPVLIRLIEEYLKNIQPIRYKIGIVNCKSVGNDSFEMTCEDIYDEYTPSPSFEGFLEFLKKREPQQ